MNWAEASNERSWRESEEREEWERIAKGWSDEELRRVVAERDWRWRFQEVVILQEYERRFGEETDAEE